MELPCIPVGRIIRAIASPFVILAVQLLVALALLVAVTLFGLARMLLRPPRMNDGKAMYLLRRLTPEDVGLPYETLSFDIRDARAGQPLRIAAWWVDAGVDRTCVLIHGYSDAKVGALAWAPTWRDAGFNLLLIDLRAHGESGGTLSTGGYYERDDLDAVLNQLRATRPAATRHVMLFGVSLGGAVALATAARRDDLAGVVADSVFNDYRTAVAAHATLMRAPLPSLMPLTLRLAQRMAAADFGDVAPMATIPRCAAPVLLIHSDADPFVPPEMVDRLADALRQRDNPRDVHWIAAGAPHAQALATHTDAYVQTIRAFADAVTSPGAHRS